MQEQLLAALWNWMRAQRPGMPRRDFVAAEADLRTLAEVIFKVGMTPTKAQ
jgi:hypothetical protein